MVTSPTNTRPPVSCLVYTLDEEVNLPHCLGSLGFAFRGAQVTADFDDSSGQVATQFGSTVPSTCSPKADAYVATVGSNDLGLNAGFYIVFYN